MAITTTEYAPVLKIGYAGPIRNIINVGTVFAAQIEKKIAQGEGSTIQFPVLTQLSQGGGAATETGPLPAAETSGYRTVTVTPRPLYWSFAVTGQALVQSQSSAGAFGEVFGKELITAAFAMARQFNLTMLRNGRVILAQLSAASDGVNPTLTVDAGHHIQPGMRLDLIDATDDVTVLGEDLLVGATVDPRGTTFAVTGTTAGTADNDYLVRANSNALEMMGIDGIIDDADPPNGDLYGIDRTVEPQWQARVFANAGVNRTLTEDLLQEATDAVFDGGGTPTHYICNRAVKRQIMLRFLPDRRFVNTMELNGGYKVVTWDDIPIIAERDTRANRLYVLDMNDYTYFSRLGDLYSFLDFDGMIIRQIQSDTPGRATNQWGGTLWMNGDLACEAPGRQAKIEDIDES